MQCEVKLTNKYDKTTVIMVTVASVSELLAAVDAILERFPLARSWEVRMYIEGNWTPWISQEGLPLGSLGRESMP